MGRSDFSPGIERSSLPSRVLPPRGPGEISWGKVEQCPAASALSTRLPRSDIGRRVAEHTCPGQTSLHEGSLAFGAAVRIQLPSHTPSRERRRLSITANLHLVQLPSTRGYLRQAPQGTHTPNHSTMPSAILDGASHQLVDMRADLSFLDPHHTGKLVLIVRVRVRRLVRYNAHSSPFGLGSDESRSQLPSCQTNGCQFNVRINQDVTGTQVGAGD